MSLSSMPISFAARLVAAGCALVLAGGVLPAQKAPGAVEGTVIDPNGKPIRDVEVTIATQPPIRSDSLGKFFVAGIEPGDHELRVRRLAFAPAVVKVEVESEDTVDVTITLSVVAQQLNAVLVHGTVARARALWQFEERRRRGFGHFITRSEIEDRHPLFMSDMVRRVPGARLSPSYGGRSVLRFTRALMGGGRDCPPQYWIDGVMAYGYNIDDIQPGDVEGVEFYAGVSVIPPEFNNPRSNAACGVVVIWTRIPGT
jgi:hypothetical protein